VSVDGLVLIFIVTALKNVSLFIMFVLYISLLASWAFATVAVLLVLVEESPRGVLWVETVTGGLGL
jgi:hypothetical protein